MVRPEFMPSNARMTPPSVQLLPFGNWPAFGIEPGLESEMNLNMTAGFLLTPIDWCLGKVSAIDDSM